MITVDEIMSNNIVTVGPEASLQEAQELMLGNRIRHLPVADEGRLLGLITQRDLLAASESTLDGLHASDRAERARDTKVAVVMTRDILRVGPGANMREAALQLQRQKVGCLPVVDGDRLLGIVTDYDFVGVAVNLLEQLELGEPEPYD